MGGPLVTEGVALFIQPYQAPRPSYLATVTGFTNVDTDPESSVTIAKIITKAMTANQGLVRILDKIKDEDVGTPILASTITSSLTIVPVQLSNRLSWNVYTRSPTIARYEEWIKWFEGLSLRSFECGDGHIDKAQFCTGCRSVDHSITRCRFPDLPDWVGPTLEQVNRDRDAFMKQRKADTRRGGNKK
jgi:hypothetical protein